MSFLLALAIVTHAVAVGEVTSTSAIFWARADRESEMTVVVESDGAPVRRESARAVLENDFTAKVRIEGLAPKNAYRYRVWFGDAMGAAERGSFRTAPDPGERASVRFAWGGDVGGQNLCRDATEGYPIFKTVKAQAPDFFIGLGDMIYADNECEPKGRYGNDQVPDGPVATDLSGYWMKWKYNREDAAFKDLLRTTPYFAIWDDHEVVNDFGPLHDTRERAPYSPGVHLMPFGLKAFLDYNPVIPSPENPGRLYRNHRWGSLLEVFFLDNRQYRDANLAPDAPARAKTMLGREQVTWLREKLERSKGLWKVIVSTVPLSVPTGSPVENGRDGWAKGDQTTGFETELRSLLEFMRDRDVRNVVFITTDVHFAEVFRYAPFPEFPSFQPLEFVTGPLNAGLFPNREFDRSLGAESLFFYGADSLQSIRTWEDAKRWFNFGLVDVGADGRLTLKIINTGGVVVFERAFPPEGDRS